MSKLNLWKLGSLVLIIFAQCSAWADNYPSKPINFIVPYGAGGGADSRSRQIAQKMSVLLKQPIIVDNKPGAGGNIGTEYIARAAPDGYTIGMGNFAPMAVNKTLFGNLRYDPETDLTPIVLVEKGPLVLVVNPNSPYKTVQDIVAAAKAKPGSLTFSSGGIGGSHQLSAELFQQNAGIEMIHVPYKSGSAGLTDLMAGNVTMMFDQMYSAMPSIKADKLRPIAITSKKRSPLLPDVPSFTEAGYPKVVVLNWQGLIAPKGTPKAIIDKLNAAANEALKDPQLRELMLSQGNEIGGGSPADFAALIKSESAKWSAVVKLANIKPE
ncbi:tripartite tricarboxylate transporter substrate binding protein [Polynucleobacter sp. MWH-P3-07-1]|uniref:Bug family tripartite tricarboxylate transporter substrate binding protein n=1 Tax=Polynucleobacter sp. MWH-P3-07-1 TaxID=1743173 RepID=UPI001BFE5374|nr:tripartite tricarboxylate transporter substrate binding protein [Polynucleobacter sp. MWH-P3-07-1]QWD83104.1 tripartite tricarboxylate transporter substrate binding protein [Polynucleobacter sp. MWH-P3-07-1]QWD92884.1 tripartite tricarboxylate transporter substrate binding protein [Polynucleobacter asymbioticus]